MPALMEGTHRGVPLRDAVRIDGCCRGTPPGQPGRATSVVLTSGRGFYDFNQQISSPGHVIKGNVFPYGMNIPHTGSQYTGRNTMLKKYIGVRPAAGYAFDNIETQNAGGTGGGCHHPVIGRDMKTIEIIDN